MINAKMIFVNLFIAAITIGIFSWLLGIIEFIFIALMKEFVFKFGVKIVNIEERAFFLTSHVVKDKISETDHGKFKFIGTQRCVFRDKMSWLSLKLHTPFPLKRCVQFKDGIAHVEGRLPVGTMTFFIAWIVGWTVGGIGYGIQEASIKLSLLMLLFGWGFVALLFFPSLALEKKDFC